MTTTARDLCTDALDEIGILGVGQSPLAEDINRVFTRLKRMSYSWQKQRWLIPSLEEFIITATGQKKYTIGLGGDLNVPRPSQIKAAYVVQRNTGQNPVSLQMTRIDAFEDYALISIKDLNSLPDHFFYDGANPLGNFYPWPIPNNTYDLHLIVQSQLGFGSTIIESSIQAQGAAYTDGQYDGVGLTNISGVGTGATADITVTAGKIAVVNLATGGQDYAIGSTLSVDPADVGGTGAGFIYSVDNIGPDLDTVLTMPPEYEEGLFYNLVIRAASAYNMPAPVEAKGLARASLNIIRKNVTQVPRLQMPVAPGVRAGKAFSLYNPDGY